MKEEQEKHETDASNCFVLFCFIYLFIYFYFFYLLKQYHGGTNFGRTTGGPFISTSYDYDAPIDEYGMLLFFLRLFLYILLM